MKNIKNLWIISILFFACKSEPKTESGTLSSIKPKYETYNYTGFTKEEKYAFHKHFLEGGRWTVGGDIERYAYLNFSQIMNYSRVLRSDTPRILEEIPRDDVKNFITTTDLKKGAGLSFSKPIDHYFDTLKNSGWEGVPVIDILSMSSGIDSPFETYDEVLDPINGLATAKSEKPSGTEYQYSIADALMLSLLVEKISGLSFRDFVEQEIWTKIGSEYSALIGINPNGTSSSYLNGMSSTLRDLARFGLAFTPSGRKGANPMISEAHLSKISKVNKNLNVSRDLKEKKYSSYLWSAVYEDGDFYKVAHGGQGLYISPKKDLLIAFYGTANTDRESNKLHVIARQLSQSGLFDLE